MMDEKGQGFEEKDPKALPKVETLEDKVDKNRKDLDDAQRRVGLLEKRIEILERK